MAGTDQYETVLHVLRSVRCDDADCGKSPNMHFAEALVEAGLIVAWQAEPPAPEGWAAVYFKERGPARPERVYTYPPGNRSAIDADAWLLLPPVPEDVI